MEAWQQLPDGARFGYFSDALLSSSLCRLTTSFLFTRTLVLDTLRFLHLHYAVLSCDDS